MTLGIKVSVLAHFKASGKGYQTRINQVLERYIRSQQKLNPPSWLIGTDWQGQPDDAMMRVDERGVAVRFAATHHVRRSGSATRVFARPAVVKHERGLRADRKIRLGSKTLADFEGGVMPDT